MKLSLLLFSVLLLSGIAHAQEVLYTGKYKIEWSEPDSLKMDGYETTSRLNFIGASFDLYDSRTPLFHIQLDVHDEHLKAELVLDDLVTELVPEREQEIAKQISVGNTFIYTYNISRTRDRIVLNIFVTPLRFIQKENKTERLISFTANIKLSPDNKRENTTAVKYATQSILATGNWHKFRISKTGMYRIGYSELQALGINPATVNPRNIRIFGNGGAPLPEKNNEPRIDDLAEIPIQVVGEEDGKFDQNDYVLMFAEGPLTWKYNPFNGYFYHRNNYYDDYSYYFITSDLGSGKRIQIQNHTGNTETVVNDFLDYALHQDDLYNLTNTGRTWYGELFDVTLERTFTFPFSNVNSSKEAFVVSEVASRNFNPAVFVFDANGEQKASLNMETTTQTGYSFAKDKRTEFKFIPLSGNQEIKLRYQRSVSSSRGWLDYISINLWRQLYFDGPQLQFRNPQAVLIGGTNRFTISGAGQQVRVWDITIPTNPFQVQTNVQDNNLSFLSPSDSIRQFIAFDGSSFMTVEPLGKVDNQNLHGLRNIDYVIISHSDFIEEANRLADFHRTRSGLNVFVTTPQPIYNEFSSGAQDITAIRDFMRMLYKDSSPGKQIRYLLLFGDASFDYKDILPGNSNYVPTWQSLPSLNIVSSIASDDYYGYLDDGEGGNTADLLDIGIGRLPVSSIEEARQMVDKVFHYTSSSDKVHGPWRNMITFVSDDSDGNLHLSDAEYLYRQIDSTVRAINFDKIYLDAYQQIATPSGQKAPDVNNAINKRMDKGTLIINYSGHGGEVGWGHERFLEIADINGWTNYDNMPVFITATCEFSRYDDAQRTSAGEMVILNPKGGAIAMFTTARATYASANRILNLAIFKDNLFSKNNGEYPRFGDVIRRSKLRGDANDRKFVLLGDPALQLALPHNKVITTHINGNPIGQQPDTLKALDVVTIKGYVADDNGTALSQYNGVLYTTVFDKASEISTKGDENGYPQEFYLFNSIIYNGKAEITDGSFEFSFMLPKDIAYTYGPGRISYYATDLNSDAAGYHENIVIGGFNENSTSDDQGPLIRLFINDTTFVPGGMTNENPILLAYIDDENGINTTGTGIGHDIVATLSGATSSTTVINEFYEAEINRQASGSIRYPFRNLKPGHHSLKLKVWDVFNNSSEATIDFVVVPGNSIKLENLINFPNPFSERTSFVFNHNQTGKELSVELIVYDLTGRTITKITRNITPSAFRSEPIDWDGRTAQGDLVGKGLYLYRLKVTTEDGMVGEIQSKLIYMPN